MGKLKSARKFRDQTHSERNTVFFFSRISYQLIEVLSFAKTVLLWGALMDRIGFSWLGVLTSGCLCAFTLVLLLDLRSAFHKRATWIPGKALVLGAFTIQLLAFVACTNLSLLRDSIKEVLYPGIDYSNLLTIYVCEVNICVFLVYFIPAMISSRSPDHLAAIVVLITGVYFPIKNFVSSSNNQGNSLFQFLCCEWTLFICILFLILLLGSALIAGITVRRILVQKISATLSTDKDEEVQPYRETDEIRTWNAFEDELFKLWMVARVSQPDYVIARSILTSAAWFMLSFLVLVSVLEIAVAWNHFEKPIRPLLLSLLVYMVEQWIVICCRCYSSLLIRKTRFCFEDFWTRALREIVDKYDLQYKWRPASSSYSLEISFKRIAALARLHKLLYLVWVFQILVVLVCKILSVLSDFVFGKILRQCRRRAWSLWKKLIKPPSAARYRYESYAGVVKRICMPGENPSDVWEANKRAINRIALLFKEGREEGGMITNCLFSWPFSMEWVDRGFQLLDKLQNTALPEIVKYFPNCENRCWKMTVVSLTLFMIELNKRVRSDRVTNAFNACSKAYDLLSFLDEIDSPLPSDSFNSGAADKEFSSLQYLYGSLPAICLEESARKITIKEAKNLCKCQEKLKEINNIVGEIQGRAEHDVHSKDWMRITPNYYLYKLCKVMEDDLEIDNMMEDLEEQQEADMAEDLISWAESSLRNVIAAGVCMVPDLLAKHCRKCVQGFDEDKIWEAIYLAGKARGMMESWGLELKWSSNEWTFQLKGITQVLVT